MTPLTVLFNIVLLMIWKLRMTSLGWMFFDSFPAVLRYPELDRLREFFKSEVQRFGIRYAYDLKPLLPVPPKTHMFVLRLWIETDDPFLAEVAKRSGMEVESREGNFELAEFLFRLLFQVPNRAFVFVDPRVWGFIYLDSWLIWKYVTGGNFWYVFGFVTLSWFGLYRILGSLLIGNWLTSMVEDWLKEKEFGALTVLALVLLPISTADAIAILSLVDAMQGKSWRPVAKVWCSGSTNNFDSTSSDFLLEYAKEAGLIDKINNKFLPQKLKEIQEELIRNYGRSNWSLDDVYRRLQKDLYDFLIKEVGEERLKFWMLKAKARSFLNRILHP